ncbi:hypothetical protein MUB24_06245 [Lederbergia sp. NSJ-179]|uniref:hypothetical protein n=1 Tax=Lederbergia sp. NSJ-179 TaxID=2931402 RepID=UPI001FD07090|nr:hypothetical protein [Lederbergia sp. NSJ-179]MCJ7840527.1 hypothetical protein [Lederbergia sp. NSJ-179]
MNVQQLLIEGYSAHNKYLIEQVREKNEEIFLLHRVANTLKAEKDRLREALKDIRECSDIPTEVEELVRQALEDSE